MPSATPVNGGPVEASNSVLNRRADREQSLFQICLNLRTRLMNLPEVARQLRQTEIEATEEESDPLNVLWNMFRKGYPLVSIYNCLNQAKPIIIDDSRMKSDKRRAQNAAFKFQSACLQELKIPQEECFMISDLFGTDTTGFVKVCIPPHTGCRRALTCRTGCQGNQPRPGYAGVDGIARG
jgi:cell division control protein 24